MLWDSDRNEQWNIVSIQICLVQSDPCYGTNVVHLLFSSKSTIFLLYKSKEKGERKSFFGVKNVHVSGNLCLKDIDVIQPCVVGWGLAVMF